MSSTKVASRAPVGLSTTSVKLNGVRLANVSSASSPISNVNDSSNIGSATDQYLLNGEDNPAPYLSEELQENSYSLPYSTLNGESSSAAQIQLQENKTFFSSSEVTYFIESYERTLEQSEEPLKKKTQGFG